MGTDVDCNNENKEQKTPNSYISASCVQRAGAVVSEGLEKLFYK